jgi:4-hydroxybenzoate polyprenyltransferase
MKGQRMTAADFLHLARVRQWVKNFFIFFPLIFSSQFADNELLWRAAGAFFVFCLVSSGIYIANDIADMARDRVHPGKSHRPLLINKAGLGMARFLSFSLCLAGLAAAWVLGPVFTSIVLGYLLTNVVYNAYAKRVVILDCFFVAIGFLFRVWAGACAVGVEPSVWLQLCVFLLALFLGFSKRRYELASLKEKASEHRDVFAHYTVYFLDQVILVCSTLTIVFYGLYTISSDVMDRVGHGMVYSLLFVVYGIFRYLYLIHVKKLGGDPGEVLFFDRPLLISIVWWVAFVFIMVYRY